MPDYYQKSLELHARYHGKLAVQSKVRIENREDLSLAYTPGVAEPCRVIAKDPKQAGALTLKANTVAVISDGSAVLGLGNIGPLAAIPVMEGKAVLFKKFADVDAFPICLDTQNTDEIVDAVRRIAPVFGGVNLEDIAAPRCFEVEARLQDLGIPVFHDDQHGTAIVVMAGIINAAKVVGKKIGQLRVVISGAGAAGSTIAKLLRCIGSNQKLCQPVGKVYVCDRQGVIGPHRTDLNEDKKGLLVFTNPDRRTGTLREMLKGADVFIGVSAPNMLTAEDIKTMAPQPIVFAMANPTPEIMPDDAAAGGGAVIATGRSDFPNQLNNVLAFPGVFRGAIDAGATRITSTMKLAAAHAIAGCVLEPTAEKIIPSPLENGIAQKVAEAVAKAWREENEGKE